MGASGIYVKILILMITALIVISTLTVFANNTSDEVFNPDERNKSIQDNLIDNTVTTLSPETEASILDDDGGSGISSTRAAFKPTISDSRVEYVIITASQFVDELQPLADWKTNKGVAAKIYTLEDIYASFTVGDNARRVHDFLRDLDSKSSYLQWILLAGDADADTAADNAPIPYVPSRFLYSGGGSSGVNDYYWSDVYYAGLTGTWDNDNNGIYGQFSEDHPYASGILTGSNGEEGDFDYEAYVGRLPGDTEAEMTTMVNKILRYEQDPPVNDWLKTAVFWGGLMDAPNVPEYDPNSWNAYEIKNQRVKPLFPSHMTIKEYYDYPEDLGGFYSPSVDKLNRNVAINSFNAGSTILNFAGQAYYDGWALIDYVHTGGTLRINQPGSYQPLYWHYDGANATNGDMLPLVYMSGCDAAVFNFSGIAKDRSQEKMLTNPNGGAIGVISSTAHTYRGEEHEKSLGNWWLDEYYWKMMFENGYYQPGKALYELKEKYYTDIENGAGKTFPTPVRSNNYGYLLLGDPELNIWTDTPRVMKVQVEDLFVGPGAAKITVTDLMTDAPVENALVNIMNVEFYLQGYTNSTGVCTIPFSPLSKGSVDIVVTAHNYYPKEVSGSIIDKPIDLSIDSSDIWVQSSTPLHGENLRVYASVYNLGGTVLSESATVRFYLDDPEVDGVPFGTDQSISSVDTGSFETVSTIWNVTYRPEPYRLYVWADPDNTINEYTRANNKAFINISVLSSDFKITENDIIFRPGNVVGEMQNITINLTIHNEGMVDASGISIGLYDGSPGSGGSYIYTASPVDFTVPYLYSNSYAYAEAVFQLAGGVHEIFVFVDDNNRTFEMNEFNNIASKNLTVNFAPKLSKLIDISIMEDSGNTRILDLHSEQYLTDIDNETAELRFSVLSVEKPDKITVTISDNRYVNIMPVENFSSNIPIDVVIEVTDGLSSDTDTFTVTVTAVVDEPVVEPLGIIYVEFDEQLLVTVNATDPDGDLLLFSDDLEEDWFVIDEFTGEINFTNDDRDMMGTYRINITVYDGELKTTMAFDLVVEGPANSPPELDHIDDFVMTVGEIFTVEITGSDPDGDPLTFTMYPEIFTITKIDDNSARFSYTPNSNDIGTDEVTIYADDVAIHLTAMTSAPMR
jgi:hypothetical protein